MPVFSILTYFLTVSIKVWCAVVVLGMVETHVHSENSPSYHAIKWLSEADATFAIFHRVFVRLMIIDLISCFTLYAWVVLVATLLLLASLFAPADRNARDRYTVELDARSLRIWNLLLGAPGFRDIQHAANDNDSVARDSSWEWIEMDNAPPVAEAGGQEDEQSCCVGTLQQGEEHVMA